MKIGNKFYSINSDGRTFEVHHALLKTLKYKTTPNPIFEDLILEQSLIKLNPNVVYTDISHNHYRRIAMRNHIEYLLSE